MIFLIMYAMCIGLLATVYRSILAYEEILNWWFVFGRRFENSFFYKPVWGCEKCFAGQIAFWTYSINWLLAYLDASHKPGLILVFKVIPKYSFYNFNVLEGLIFISIAIATAAILAKLYELLIK